MVALLSELVPGLITQYLHLRWPITIGWVFGNHDHNHGINFELSLVTRGSILQAFGIYRDNFKFHPKTSLN